MDMLCVLIYLSHLLTTAGADMLVPAAKKLIPADIQITPLSSEISTSTPAHTKHIRGVYSKCGQIAAVHGQPQQVGEEVRLSGLGGVKLLQHTTKPREPYQARIHPMQLCMSEYSMISDINTTKHTPPSIFIIKLEKTVKLRYTRQCLSTTEKVSRAFQFGAKSVVLLSHDYTDVESELADVMMPFSGPVILIESRNEEDKLYLIMQSRHSALMTITPDYPTTPQPTAHNTVKVSREVIYIILISVGVVILLVLGVVCTVAVTLTVRYSRQKEITSPSPVMV